MNAPSSTPFPFHARNQSGTLITINNAHLMYPHSQMVTGIPEPNAFYDETFLDIEPWTGATMNGHQRLQVSVCAYVCDMFLRIELFIWLLSTILAYLYCLRNSCLIGNIFHHSLSIYSSILDRYHSLIHTDQHASCAAVVHHSHSQHHPQWILSSRALGRQERHHH